MKKKVGAFLLTMLLAISTMAPVYAAENVTSMNVPHTTNDLTFIGNSYQTSYDGMTCICTINSDYSVTAGTGMSGQFVSVSSKAYAANGNNIGSGGGNANNNTTTSYSTSPNIIYRCENDHSASNAGLSIHIILKRY